MTRFDKQDCVYLRFADSKIIHSKAILIKRNFRYREPEQENVHQFKIVKTTGKSHLKIGDITTWGNHNVLIGNYELGKISFDKGGLI